MEREFPTIQFHSDIDNSIFDSINPAERNLVILDDVMSEAGDSKSVAKLFTQGSQNRNMTVVFLVQNLFHQAKQMRNISLNTHITWSCIRIQEIKGKSGRSHTRCIQQRRTSSLTHSPTQPPHRTHTFFSTCILRRPSTCVCALESFWRADSSVCSARV